MFALLAYFVIFIVIGFLLSVFALWVSERFGYLIATALKNRLGRLL